MKPVHYIILALLAAIGLMWFFWPSNKPDYSLHEARIAQREQAISELQVENAKLLSRIKADSVSHKIEVQAYKDRDKKKSREIARIKASPRVVEIIRENPAIDTLLQAYDSLLESKDQQLQLAEKYISNLQLDIGELKNNFEERIKLQSETIGDLNAIVDDQRKTIRKERRAKRLAKVIAVAGTIGAFVLGSQL